MKLLILSLSVVILALGPITPSVNAQTNNAVEASQIVTGLDVAKTISPLECQLISPQDGAFLQMVESIKLSDDMILTEAELPGISRYMSLAMLPYINAFTRGSIDDLWNEQARLIDGQFTPEETKYLLAFYQTPTGQRIISGMCGDIDIAPILDEAVRTDNEDGKVSNKIVSQTLNVARKDVAANVTDSMTQEEEKEFLQLAKKANLMKIFKIRDAMTQAYTDWMNQGNPVYDPLIEAAAASAADEFVAAVEEGREPVNLTGLEEPVIPSK